MLEFKAEELDIHETPNIDFIGTVEVDNGTVVYRTYPIDVPQQLFLLLRVMVLDDSRSVLDMQSVIDRAYPRLLDSAVDPNFLAPCKLNDRDVHDVQIPKRITKDELLRAEQEVEDKIRNRHQLEAELNDSQILEPGDVRIAKKILKHRQIRKWRYYNLFLRFESAFGYGEALSKNRIKERLGHDVRMYSTDTIGWTTYDYAINQDVRIQPDSNFGYGHSSYFLLSLKYKGVEIYTFSDYVQYPYANMRALIAHTRTYRLERDSWSDALQFVADVANVATRSPQTFAETFILGEVRKMVDGLHDILRMSCMPCEYINHENGEKVQYLGVATNGLYGYNSYAATPDEMLLVLKSERIIGALGVLKKLKVFDEIDLKIKEAIAELIGMVKGQVPELENGMHCIGKEIREYEYEVGFLRNILHCVHPVVKEHDLCLQKREKEALSKLGSDMKSRDRDALKQNVQNQYKKENPDYLRVQKIEQVSEKELNSLQDIINQRRAFLAELEKCHSVGIKGERFWGLVEKLYPHEVEIENEVDQRVHNIQGECLIRGLDGLRNSVRTKYFAEHEDARLLFEEQNRILDDINTFPCCQCIN